MREVEERFLRKIAPRPNGCWIWLAGKQTSLGYGQFWDGERQCSAHRFAYEHFRGRIPGGMTLDHLCRNPSCVNPAHLEPVTLRENILRGTGFTARNARKTHAPCGHPYNVQSQKYGRYCKECSAKQHAIRSARHRAKGKLNA